ncbi:MAG: acyltransferase [Candidatus Eremiobacteraeota bacterium]|nr:acyltransferase [Candidatus Eremiobacteraeota bacterium]
MREHVRLGTEVVDGFRGIAILLVLSYHTWLFSWYTPVLSFFGYAVPVDVLPRTGYLGVDLFFLISGFVLFFPHAERALASGVTSSVREYARRRAIKIVPSYLVALIATIPAVLAVAPAHTLGQLAGTFAQHVFFVHNFFDDGFGPENSVFWSLAVEAQFYLVFPILAVLFRKQPLAVATAMIASAIAYRYAVAQCCLEVQTISRQIPAYADVFAVGMLASYAVVWGRTRLAPARHVRLIATLAAVAFACIAFAFLGSANAIQYDPGGRERWDLYNRTWIALAAGGLVVASCFAQTWWRAIVANRAFLFLSIVSYNLYLWHTLVMIWMWKHGVPHAATTNPHDDDRWKAAYIALGWATSIGIATTIAYFFERPLLGTVKRQIFAFDWSDFASRYGIKRAPAIAPRETRT